MSTGQHVIQSAKIVTLGVLVALSMNFAFAAWTPPPANPPNSNADAPLNVSNSGQIKAGGLTLNTGNAVKGLIVQKGVAEIGQTSDPVGLLNKLFVYGKLGADLYCDRNGQGCKTIAELGGSGDDVTRIVAGANIAVTPASGVGVVTITNTMTPPTPPSPPTLYTRSSAGENVNVYCNAGDAATGGGPRNSNQGDVHSTHPIKAGAVPPNQNEMATGWHCATENLDNCYVVCMDL